MVWKSNGEPVKYEDASKLFGFVGTRAACQLEAEVDVPALGFHGSPTHRHVEV